MLLGSNGTHNVGILTVCIANCALPVEAAAHHRSKKNWYCTLCFRLRNESNQVCPIIRRWSVAVGFFLRLIVVPELNEHVITRVQRIDNPLPQAFTYESASAATILR